MERRDGRPVPHRERRRAEHRRQRLVHVDEIEALARERTAQLRQRVRAQDEVRERAVAGHDHRPAERDHVRRRRSRPPGARVEDAAERARRIVPDQQARLDPDVRQCARLRLGVVDDAAAERPRVRHHDPDLHPRRGYRRRASRSPRTAPASRSCASTRHSGTVTPGAAMEELLAAHPQPRHEVLEVGRRRRRDRRARPGRTGRAAPRAGRARRRRCRSRSSGRECPRAAPGRPPHAAQGRAEASSETRPDEGSPSPPPVATCRETITPIIAYARLAGSKQERTDDTARPRPASGSGS